jgi:hypothetical protein
MQGLLRSDVSECRVGMGSGWTSNIVGFVLVLRFLVEKLALILAGVQFSKHHFRLCYNFYVVFKFLMEVLS